ncbi:MAG: peptide deformylase [Chloroflexi bacterium CFX4]|nr:peptide deformylase [Chloroflexi bacterium CFX4]MDL1922003.1 peptide deformylase [Chloroflexi bacterium CFX3]
MAVKKILTLSRHEKLLRTKSEPVKKITKQVKQLAEDIRDTILVNPAVGLAAVQIGVLLRVFGARIGYYDQAEGAEDAAPPQIFINPEIVAIGEETERDFDACMSIPGMMGYTQRATQLTMRWQDEHGARHERQFSGWDARMLLHEYDHLEGVLFLDRLPLEDLYVYVRGADGKSRTVPYLEVMRAAEVKDATSSTPIKPTDG